MDSKGMLLDPEGKKLASVAPCILCFQLPQKTVISIRKFCKSSPLHHTFPNNMQSGNHDYKNREPPKKRAGSILVHIKNKESNKLEKR